MSRFYFHCSDGVDLVLDREGVESEASDVLWLGMRAAERLITALPSYDDWPTWTVSVHDERGSAQCRFIISAPEQKPMFCGEATTNGGSWCAWHRSIVYRNEQPVSPQHE